jgi:iron complex transport system substrate-binding protein
MHLNSISYGLRVSVAVILLLSVLGGSGWLETSTAQSDSGDFPITIIDATGREVTITSIDRIVSGSGDITEIVVALGLRDNLVGVDISSTYPDGVLDEVGTFGFARRLTLEPIVAMNPTVFLCVQTCMPDTVLEQLRSLDIPVVILPDGDDVDLTLPMQKIRMASAALGVPERGEVLAQRIATEIDWAQTATANIDNRPYVLLLYFRGSRLQLVYGANTPAEALIEGAGGIEAAGEIGVDGYIPLTTEILLTAFPDYVLLMESGVDSAGGLELVRDLQGMSQTPAGQQENFLVYDDQYLLALSTRTGAMLLDLAADIHDDLTWELEVAYPYMFKDDTGTDLNVTAPPLRIATSDDLLPTVRRLGFHPVTMTEAEDNLTDTLFVVTEATDYQRLRDAGAQVIVLAEDVPLTRLAEALNVPGRGLALAARFAAES